MTVNKVSTFCRFLVFLYYNENKSKSFTMKTINLTDEQFDTLFGFVNQKVESIVDASVDYQDSEILDEWEDLFDVHTVLETVDNWS